MTKRLGDMRVRVMSTENVIPRYAELCARYEWVSEAWNPDLYTVTLHESLQGLEPVAGKINMFVKHFGCITASEQVRFWAAEEGYRVCFPHEREAFVKQVLNLREVFRIIDLGSSVEAFSVHCVPILVGNAKTCGLGDDHCGSGWEADVGFLFVVK